jgi:hypothetical protein
VSTPKAAAVTHFVCGGFVALRAVSGLLQPPELPKYDPVWNAFLFQYGGPLTGLVVGAGLLAVGVITWRAKDPADATRELVFSNDAEIPLAPVMAGFLVLLGSLTLTAVLPYTGERGVEPGQIALALALFPMLLLGAWVLLHHRRLVIVDTVSRTVQFTWGKPWAALRQSFPFASYDTLAIDVVPRSNATVYRVVATGPGKGPKLITFCFSETRAKESVESIARATGWKAPADPVSPA